MKKFIFLLLVAMCLVPFSTQAAYDVFPGMYGPHQNLHAGYTVEASGYIKVVDSCLEHFEGECVNIRSNASTSAAVLRQIRNNFVREIDQVVWDGTRWWYRITHDNEPIRFPSRLGARYWYIAADYAEWIGPVDDVAVADPEKWLEINTTDQTLTAYIGDEPVRSIFVSTGIDQNPTPRGEFEILSKMPTRYMQGPLSNLGILDSWDLPGAAFTMYFTHSGAAIHVAPWHRSFGQKYSHGCVNTTYDDGAWLWDWVAVGTKVVVRS